MAWCNRCGRGGVSERSPTGLCIKCRTALAPKGRPKIHNSTDATIHSVTSSGAVSHNKRNTYDRSILLPSRVLGIRDAIAAGSYVMDQIRKREEFKAQHGPVKILMKNGKPVDPIV